MTTRTALPKVCIALGLPTVEKLLDHAEKEVAAGEHFLEFRLDYLPRPEAGLKAITAFLQKHPDVQLLATCRRHQNHGKFNGVIDDQMRILDAAIDAGARAIDVEIETAEKTELKLEHMRAKAHLIISWHNYEGTPPLEPVLRRMMKVPADAYKIVTTAKKPSDAAKVLALQKVHPKVPMILLAMGEVGFATRVLCNAQGGVYTYASPNSVEGTAAGQVNARVLKQMYRIDKLTKNAKIYGVVADPVRHSLSPTVHNRAFQARRLDAVYLPFLVKPTQLKDFLSLCDSLPVQGFSVTLPHKEEAAQNVVGMKGEYKDQSCEQRGNRHRREFRQQNPFKPCLPYLLTSKDRRITPAGKRYRHHDRIRFSGPRDCLRLCRLEELHCRIVGWPC